MTTTYYYLTWTDVRGDEHQIASTNEATIDAVITAFRGDMRLCVVGPQKSSEEVEVAEVTD